MFKQLFPLAAASSSSMSSIGADESKVSSLTFCCYETKLFVTEQCESDFAESPNNTDINDFFVLLAALRLWNTKCFITKLVLCIRENYEIFKFSLFL